MLFRFQKINTLKPSAAVSLAPTYLFNQVKLYKNSRIQWRTGRNGGDHRVNFRCPHFPSFQSCGVGSEEDYFGHDRVRIQNRPKRQLPTLV